jgi:hypothetical protein
MPSGNEGWKNRVYDLRALFTERSSKAVPRGGLNSKWKLTGIGFCALFDFSFCDDELLQRIRPKRRRLAACVDRVEVDPSGGSR